MLPFQTYESKVLFPDPNLSYRFKEEFTISDSLLSLFLGVSVSITRRTLVVEDCPVLKQSQLANVSLGSENPEFQTAVQSAVDAYLKQKEKEYEEVLDATISKNKKDLHLRDDLSTIWLKSGQLMQGEILSQNEEGIVLKTDKGNTETILKSKVLMVKFPKGTKE